MGRRLTEYDTNETRAFVEELDDEDDPRTTFARLQARINEYRQAGWQVPDDLRRIERQLMTDFMAESQGR